MSRVYYCSDLHIGHSNIGKYRTFVDSCEENTELILEQWNSTVTKRDTVLLLGDILFDSKYNEVFKDLKGRKILVMGNHCYQHSKYDNEKAFEVYDQVHGFMKRSKAWLSHCPIHPSELRNKYNVYGHVHTFKDIIPDTRYFNVNTDILYPVTGSIFIQERQVKDMLYRGEPLVKHSELHKYSTEWDVKKET